MSEYIENENENVEEVVEASEAVEEAVEAEDVVEETAEEASEEAAEEEPSLDDQLFDKVQRAARLLRNRKFAMGREAEADAARASELMRALKLLELKPQMEQKEMSDLLGMRLRELDGILREAEEVGAVTRIMPEEEDMRAILVSANENAGARRFHRWQAQEARPAAVPAGRRGHRRAHGQAHRSADRDGPGQR